MIGKVLFAGAVAAGVGFGYPLANEHAGNACQALEKRYIAMYAPAYPLQRPAHAIGWAIADAYLEPWSDGRIAATQMKRRYPALPPQVGCTVNYWESLIDPRVQQGVEQAMN